MIVCPAEILLIVTTPVKRNSCKMPLLADDALKRDKKWFSTRLQNVFKFI